ncbi:MAG: hypothetical protein LIO52_03750 [Oscillospiraceae bacterium]|nr:hypothetical protein [Oscillospiraceae bacterium]
MIALTIIILLLAALLLMSVGVDVVYSAQGFVLRAKAGFVRITILPKKQKDKPEKPKKEKKAKKKKEPTEEDAEKPKNSLGINKDDIFYFASLGLKALGRLRRRLSIDLLSLHLVWAAADPFTAATGYGRIAAILHSVLSLLRGAVNIRSEDITTDIDFTTDKMKIDARVKATFQIWEILYIALCAGVPFLVWYLKRRRTIKKSAKSEQTASAAA